MHAKNHLEIINGKQEKQNKLFDNIYAQLLHIITITVWGKKINNNNNNNKIKTF